MTAAAGLSCLALLAGCGGDDPPPPPPPHTVDGVRSCLSDEGRFSSVRRLRAGGDAIGLTALDKRAVAPAVRGSSAVVVARAGGPSQDDGTIVEAPVRVTQLLFFADPAAARRAGLRLESALDRSTTSVDGIRALGHTLVIHSSFGIGDRPAHTQLDAAELEPIERCLRATGFL